MILERVKVENPQLAQSGSIMYSISAYDKNGFFSEIKKRYHDFFVLHELFLNRYRGLYLPQLPPKKTFNNKDRAFIEERRCQLQEFLINICRHDYLYQSEEFHAFARSTPEKDLVPGLKEKIKFDIGK